MPQLCMAWNHLSIEGNANTLSQSEDGATGEGELHLGCYPTGHVHAHQK